MDIVAQKKKNGKRYLPHTVSTKEGAVKLYRQTKDIDFVLRRYHISKASLMRWNKLYDGTRESLATKSHRPHSQHPNAHTEEELSWIRNYHRRSPNISICELYGKLRQEKAYHRHPGSLYRVFVRLGYRKKAESTKKKSKHLGHYSTPTELGQKWQMDVKYVPAACYVGSDGEKFYQYTMIEEASRERYIYAYKEASSYSTVDFVQHAILYFGYAPNVIQTDNGGEFTHTQKTSRTHPLDALCSRLHIHHKTIRPSCPPKSQQLSSHASALLAFSSSDSFILLCPICLTNLHIFPKKRIFYENPSPAGDGALRLTERPLPDKIGRQRRRCYVSTLSRT